MVKISKFKNVFVIALFASVLATPLAIRAYAQEDEIPTETETVETVETVEVVEEETTEEPIVEEVVVPVVETPEVIEEDEEPVVEEPEVPAEPTAVALAEAVIIAQTEHPDSEVVMAKVKLKKLDAEKVYKVVFADGWRIYVRASDGEIVRIKDASDKKHDCSKRGEQAVAAWRAKWEKKFDRWEDRKERQSDRRDRWNSRDDNSRESRRSPQKQHSRR